MIEGVSFFDSLSRYHQFPAGIQKPFQANQVRLVMGILAYNLLHMIRKFCVEGEKVWGSIDWLIKRLIKVGARVSYHAQGCTWPRHFLWLTTTEQCRLGPLKLHSN